MEEKKHHKNVIMVCGCHLAHFVTWTQSGCQNVNVAVSYFVCYPSILHLKRWDVSRVVPIVNIVLYCFRVVWMMMRRCFCVCTFTLLCSESSSVTYDLDQRCVIQPFLIATTNRLAALYKVILSLTSIQLPSSYLANFDVVVIAEFIHSVKSPLDKILFVTWPSLECQTTSTECTGLRF